jgi:hypothetical protein
MPGIYVERRVRGSVDEVWRLTQKPEIHQRWDLRFTEIRYLPRIEEEPQRFLYATRLIPGIEVAGTGESVGERVAYRDPLGRETVSWVRTFETTKRRRFDAYIIWSEQRAGSWTTWERISTWRSTSTRR